MKIFPFLVIILLTGCSSVSLDLDEVAQCMSEKGAKMYGAYWCSACSSQKHIFKESWQYMDYVECSTPDGTSQNPECQEAGITSYPTWVFPDGTTANGVLTPEDLAARTGC